MNVQGSRDEIDPELELALKISLEYSRNDARSYESTPGTSGLSNSSSENFLGNRKRLVDLNDRYPVPKKLAISNEHDEDYQLALKLSEELNGQIATPVNNEEDDLALALRLSKEGDPDDVIEIIDDHENDDFLLAVQLTEEDFQSKIDLEKTVVPVKRNNSQASHSADQSDEKNYGDETISVVDPSWETIDPVPDIYALFGAFNKRFFWGKLSAVEVKWSPRMTQCAGVCSYSPRAGFCSVRLSQPLLKLRPRKDLVETMLHEMIHAFLFVTRNDRDRDGHGPRFLEHMNRINKASGAHITVYHSFHDEVRHYKTHWWKCNGSCQHRAPYYGFVKRSMNRAPGPNDVWWNDHRATCGGEFIKVKEPENFGNKKQKKKDGAKAPVNVLDNYFHKPQTTTSSASSSAASTSSYKPPNTSSVTNSPAVDQFKNFASSAIGSTSPGTSNGLNRGQKILSLVDLNVKKNANGSLLKNSDPNSKSSGKSKFVPLQGQKKIFQFINDNDWS